MVKDFCRSTRAGLAGVTLLRLRLEVPCRPLELKHHITVLILEVALSWLAMCVMICGSSFLASSSAAFAALLASRYCIAKFSDWAQGQQTADGLPPLPCPCGISAIHCWIPVRPVKALIEILGGFNQLALHILVSLIDVEDKACSLIKRGDNTPRRTIAQHLHLLVAKGHGKAGVTSLNEQRSVCSQ